MKTEYKIQVRAFPVSIRDNRTGEIMEDIIVLDRERLRAADQSAGIDSKELIKRLYGRDGFKVLDIGEVERRTISMDLTELWRLHSLEVPKRDQ